VARLVLSTALIAVTVTDVGSVTLGTVRVTKLPVTLESVPAVFVHVNSRENAPEPLTSAARNTLEPLSAFVPPATVSETAFTTGAGVLSQAVTPTRAKRARTCQNRIVTLNLHGDVTKTPVTRP
jgi:hypothetical protein